jgi:hypothetical protein
VVNPVLREPRARHSAGLLGEGLNLPGTVTPSRPQVYENADGDGSWGPESTNIHNRERTERFVQRYGQLPIQAVDDDLVREYRRSGRNDGTIAALRAMFNDAARADAGHLGGAQPIRRPTTAAIPRPPRPPAAPVG